MLVQAKCGESKLGSGEKTPAGEGGEEKSSGGKQMRIGIDSPVCLTVKHSTLNKRKSHSQRREKKKCLQEKQDDERV